MYVKILSFLPNCDEIDMGQKYTKNMHTYWGMPADPQKHPEVHSWKNVCNAACDWLLASPSD